MAAKPRSRTRMLCHLQLVTFLAITILLAAPLIAFAKKPASSAKNLLHQQKIRLLKTLEEKSDLSKSQLKQLSHILLSGRFISQGNPSPTEHPVRRETCLETLKEHPLPPSGKASQQCGRTFMVPIYPSENGINPEVCIDQFEFPGIPCEYPLVWVRANEAHKICQAVGKRLCDAAEWEQACAGKPRKSDYVFRAQGQKLKESHRAQRVALNKSREKIWSYGEKQNHGLCGTGSKKSPGCDKAIAGGGSVWKQCGSNTYPAGYFRSCRSPSGAYDLHGNAAEHMNLPLSPGEQTYKAGTGVVEMKGSWFIFGRYPAHPDDCFWRAPFWHGTRLTNPKSHHNYHLGFRCCKSIDI